MNINLTKKMAFEIYNALTLAEVYVMNLKKVDKKSKQRVLQARADFCEQCFKTGVDFENFMVTK